MENRKDQETPKKIRDHMKGLIFLFLMILALAARSQAPTSGEERVLLGLETTLVEAIATHKDDFINNLFDDQYHGITPTGTVVDKTKWLELLKTNNPYIVFNIEDVKATIYGHMAIVHGKLVGKSKSGTIMGVSRYIHVFIKKNEAWKIIEEQSTLVLE